MLCSRSHCGRQSGTESDGNMGKPPETAGRKATGAKVDWIAQYQSAGRIHDASLAANYSFIISKPLEITGRKAMGAKVLRYYASPAAGYFASV